MRLHISKFILLSFIGLLIGQDQSPYLDIANELLVRKKLSSKLPDVFDDAKFSDIIDNLDQIAESASPEEFNQILENTGTLGSIILNDEPINSLT